MMKHFRSHDVAWIDGEPPSPPLRLAELLERVAAKPETWAIAGSYPARSSATAIARRIRLGQIGPGGEWETAVRAGTDRWDLYVRYLGAGDEA
jgi:hypothetical protein